MKEEGSYPVCRPNIRLSEDNKSRKNELILVIQNRTLTMIALSCRDPVDSVDVPMWVPSDHRSGRLSSGCWHGVVPALYRHPTAVPHRRHHVRYVATSLYK